MSKQRLNPELLLLIKKISKDVYLQNNFYLAGGTALVLYFNHRVSLDFFTQSEFNINTIQSIILKLDGKILISVKGSIHSIINGIKVSFIRYNYDLLKDFKLINNIKVASVADIACMKFIAVSQKAEKKDFFDIYEILKHFTIKNIKEFLESKYTNSELNLYHITKSLTYFKDAETSPEPISNNTSDWGTVKNYFIKNENEFLKVFVQ